MSECRNPSFKRGKNVNRLIFTGTGSGCGKTTVVCAILAAMKKAGYKPASFKCGPDYIDPMFHTKVLGINSKNLDLFMCGLNAVSYLLAEGSADSDISIIEGVMGMYDGIGTTGEASSNQLSLQTGTPAILIVNCSGVSTSAAATALGFLDFDDNNIQGIILNKISAGYYPTLKAYIEEKTGVRVYGFLPKEARADLESRHLGLVIADEVKNLNEKLDLLAEHATANIELDALYELAQTADPLFYADYQIEQEDTCNIGVAMDNAFCFYYDDNLRLLEKLGARLRYFSPLKDKYLPIGLHGLYFGGGYPELYLEQLSRNKSLMRQIKYAMLNGMPTFAECGGFMYLQQYIESKSGQRHDMVGLLPGGTQMTGSLRDFGYVNLTANVKNVFGEKGESIHAHEFHYSQSEFPGDSFTATRLSGSRRHCIHASSTMFAGYPHIHLWGNVEFARNFVKKCVSYAGRPVDVPIEEE